MYSVRQGRWRQYISFVALRIPVVWRN
jgi:hypothetical protein